MNISPYDRKIDAKMNVAFLEESVTKLDKDCKHSPVTRATPTRCCVVRCESCESSDERDRYQCASTHKTPPFLKFHTRIDTPATPHAASASISAR